ncbi:Crp/Fnr family transcriptional regulator [Chloroflexota bacterium]
MTIKAECLKVTRYFSGLGDELDSISKFFFEKEADKGEVILLEGDPAEVLYFVVSGVVKVFKTSADGKEQILYLARPGDSFNDVPVFGGGENLMSAGAMSSVVLCGIKKADLEAMLQGNLQLSLNVTGVLSRMVQYLVSLVEDLSFKNVTNRVAKILLEHAGDGAGGNPRLTQQEMAAIAGTAREMVGRSLKSLEEDGKIRLERHRIIITDQQALREMAGMPA